MTIVGVNRSDCYILTFSWYMTDYTSIHCFFFMESQERVIYVSNLFHHRTWDSRHKDNYFFRWTRVTIGFYMLTFSLQLVHDIGLTWRFFHKVRKTFPFLRVGRYWDFILTFCINAFILGHEKRSQKIYCLQCVLGADPWCGSSTSGIILYRNFFQGSLATSLYYVFHVYISETGCCIEILFIRVYRRRVFSNLTIAFLNPP